ncbi:hypothetical protein ABK040_008628 [Willaertia magna]
MSEQNKTRRRSYNNNSSDNTSNNNDNNSNNNYNNNRGGNNFRGGRGRGRGRGTYNNRNDNYNNNRQGGNNYNRKQEGREGEEQSTRPTHFFAVRINAPTILSDIMKWQKNLLEHHNSKQQGLTKNLQQGLKQNISSLSASSITSSSYSNNNNENKVFKLEDYQIENSRMHLTLFVLNCGEKEELELTKQVFQECGVEISNMIKQQLKDQPIYFSLQGVHTFRDSTRSLGRVVYTEPIFPNEITSVIFKEMSKIIHLKLKEKGIKVDKKVNDQLHCTLLKTSQVRGKDALRNLPEYVYEYEKLTWFGKQDEMKLEMLETKAFSTNVVLDDSSEIVKEVLLCRMKPPFEQDGFYFIEDRISLN